MVQVIGRISRRTSSIGVISLLVLTSMAPAWAKTDQPGRKEIAPAAFHEPHTEAEKTLNAILKLSDQVSESSWYAVDAPWRDKSKDGVFRGLFTQRLRDSWVSAERAAVQKNCNGSYVSGEICGIDIHPITCSQDAADEYIYDTIRSSSGKAVINYRWPHGSEKIATFRLIHKGNGWVLDGVACTGYMKFNMP